MKLGPYEIAGELGRGATATVYRGRSPEGRDVAVKVLHRGSDDALALGRFERERRLLSALGETEGFVPFLDAGQLREGLFLVMPFVGGGTLRDRLRRGSLGPEGTVALGTKLARALARAHALGIVHRDMKPENVLFTQPGELGEPLVTDLGLAKHFRGDSPGASQSVQLSRGGELRGTAGYMPPEQMRDARSAGPAADVFALGAILVECLTGEPAFGGASLIEVLARVETGLREPVRVLAPKAPAWLTAVLERALATEPGARFADASELARALESGPAGHSKARGVRGPVALVLGVVLLGGVGAVATRLSRGHATPSPSPSPPVRAASPSPVTSSVPVAPKLPRLTASFERTRTTALLSVWGRYEWSHAGNVSDVRVLPDGKHAVSTAADGCLRLWEIATGAELWSTHAHEGAALAVAVSPDGKLAVTGGADAKLRLWDLEARSAIATVTSAHPENVNAVAFSHDGQKVLSGSRTDRNIGLWDVAGIVNGESRPRLEMTVKKGGASSVAFLPDDQRALSTASDGALHLWTLATGEEVRDFARDTGAVGCCAVSPDGRTALSSGEDGKIREWDLESGALRRTLDDHRGSVVTLAFSPDGRRMLSGGTDRLIRLWDVASGRVVAKLAGHARTVKTVAFSPDGQTALSAGTDQSIRVWDLAAAARGKPYELEPRGGHQGYVHAVAFLDGGRKVLSAGFDETLRLWDTATGHDERVLTGNFPFKWFALSPDERSAVVGGGGGGALRVFDLAAWKPGAALEGHSKPVTGGAWLPDGHALTVSEDGSFRTWDAATGRCTATVKGLKNASFSALTVLAGGERVATGGVGGGLRLWSLPQVREVTELARNGPSVVALAFLADGRLLVASRTGPLRLFDQATGAPLALACTPGRGALALAVSTDGRLGAVSGEDGTIELVSLPDGRAIDRIDLGPSSDRALGLAFDPEGKALVVGTARGVVLRFAVERN